MLNRPSLELALAYIARYPGRYLFPIKPGAKFPPLIRNNLENASNDAAQLIAWDKKWPGCNWGLALKKSRVFVADVDTKEGKFGQQTYDELDLLYGWPDTGEIIQTPSGGFHRYYEGDHIFALGTRGLGLDIDSPNYVLIAGCTFKDGTSYQAIGDGTDTAPAPQWFYDVISQAKVKVTNAGEAAVELDLEASVTWAIDYLRNDAEPSIEGKGGDFQTLKVAMSLRDNGISEPRAIELMNEYYNVPGMCEPEWTIEELTVKVRNAYTYASMSQIGGKTAEADFADDDVTAVAATIKVQGNPQKIARERTERKKEQKREDERSDEERQRYWTKAEVCEDWVWINSIERFVRVSDPTTMWKKAAFNSAFAYLAAGTKKVKGGNYADYLLSLTKNTIDRFDRVAYLPGQPRAIGNGDTFNIYTPPDLEPAEGDVSWWDDHLAYLFPDESDRNHILNWMAWLIQNIGEKPKHALLVQGREQGTGKSFLVEVLAMVLNRKNVATVSQIDLQSNFNGWAGRSKLLRIEELRALDRMDVERKLHELITQENISINQKGIDAYDIMNCFGIFAMTNNDAAVSLENGERRYLVVRTDAMPRSEEYYTTLYARLKDRTDMAAVAYSLFARDVSKYDGRGKAPLTSAKEDMVDAGLSDLEHWMIDNGGSYPLNGRVIAVQDIVDLLPNRLSRLGRINAAVSTVLKNRFRAKLAGQFTLSSRSRARLYVINGSAIMNLADWRETIGGIYEGDKQKAGKGQTDDSAEDDFGVGGDD